MNRIRTNLILIAVFALTCCTQPSKSRFMTGRVVEIADGKVSITTDTNDTLQFSTAANNIDNLVLNDAVAIKYVDTEPSDASDVIVLNEKPSIDNVSRMLVGSWKSDSLQILLCEDCSAEIITEYNTEKTQWTLFNNMVVFDSKSTTDATLTYTLTRVSPDFLHLTKGGATIVFERLVRRGL
ncbi:MAG: hypothetical protein IKR17_04590 [Bacteroidales bacterium]|nr:hypothetical protein [Bacteroidales bacterium]